MTTEFTNTNFETLLSAEQINARVKQLGAQITKDYANQEPI